MAPKNQTVTSESTATSVKNINKSTKSKKVLPGIVLLSLLILAGLAFYFYSKYSNLKTDPNEKVQAEVDDLISQVSKLIVLPENEKPTVATVTDVEKLRSQAFFANAQNGYKVLIYTQSKKAILFDPVTNRIIEVAPIDIGNQATVSTQPAPVIEQQISEESTLPETSEPVTEN